MLNRYSLVFYLLGLSLLIIEKNIIAFVVIVIAGFIVGYIYSMDFTDELEEVNTPYSFDELKLFNNKNELVEAVKGSTISEEKNIEQKLIIDFQKTFIFIAIYFATILFLYVTFKDLTHLLSLLLIPFLIVTNFDYQEEKE